MGTEAAFPLAGSSVQRPKSRSNAMRPARAAMAGQTTRPSRNDVTARAAPSSGRYQTFWAPPRSDTK